MTQNQYLYLPIHYIVGSYLAMTLIQQFQESNYHPNDCQRIPQNLYHLQSLFQQKFQRRYIAYNAIQPPQVAVE
jgi:hypothetical protein